MSYYLAPSLAALRSEINDRWPNRDKSSDGWIGDPSHQARVSDHNPDYADGGVVRALDIDEDDIDTDAVLARVLHDPRVSYVIYERRIWGGTRWRPYTGSNGHTKHIHVSIKHSDAAEKAGSWGIKGGSAKPQASKPKAKVSGKSWPAVTLALSSVHTDASHDAWVELMAAIGYRDRSLTTAIQRWLKKAGYYKGIIEADHGKRPVFGPMLVKALQRFLAKKGLYKGLIDGKREGMTIKAEIRYLNLPANRGVKK